VGTFHWAASLSSFLGKNMNEWENKDNHLEKTFKFKNYREVLSFVNAVADLANAQNHHPQMIVDFNRVVVRTTTHDAGNTITEKDEKLTLAIDHLL
jgi:4a-hydroxytetrahydrobiopterin dehydratase